MALHLGRPGRAQGERQVLGDHLRLGQVQRAREHKRLDLRHGPQRGQHARAGVDLISVLGR